MDMHTIVGARLSALRAVRGLTIAAMETATGLPAIVIERHEAGEAIPLSRLQLFASVLRVNLASFFVERSDAREAALPSDADADEGLRLVRALRRIRNAEVRHVLIDIADHLADEG